VFDKLKMRSRYIFGLRRFLRQRLSSEQCRRMITEQLQNRGEMFLRILRQGIYENSRSPYRKLLLHAGMELDDVARLVRKDGIEAALQQLYQEGVFVSHDEFKCRRPIQRGSLTFSVRSHDFDNPLLAQDYEARTGGSRGIGTRVIIDFDVMLYDAAYHDLLEDSFGISGQPLALWRPLPPAASGIYRALRIAKLGKRIDKWFTPNTFSPTLTGAGHFLFVVFTIYGCRLFGGPMPFPEYAPLDNGLVVLRWLMEKRAAGQPGVVFTQTTSAVRLCREALEKNLDISGSSFFVGGEPYTSAKAKILTQAGCRGIAYYSMTELGDVAQPCADAQALDDFHFLEDKLAVIQRTKPIGESGLTVGAFFFTTLLPSSPKLLLNVDSGDYGKLERRDCRCLLGQLGLHTHMSEIRSYDKLTNEGMTFLGSDLIRLTEDLLPEKFGGYPTDYQFVEVEIEGIPNVLVRVSPRIGAIDEAALIDTIMDALATRSAAHKMMADRWREAHTLRVLRAEPVVTMVGKTLPLHILNRTKQ